MDEELNLVANLVQFEGTSALSHRADDWRNKG